MAHPTPDRRAELIAAALADDLSATERAEFAELIQADPSIAVELAELAGTVEQVRAITPASAEAPWIEQEPPADLRARVLEAARADDDAERGEPARRWDADDAVHGPDDGGREARDDGAQARDGQAAPERNAGTGRVRWFFIAAACFLAGVLVTVGTVTVMERPPSGPPGTLGAEEVVAFESVPADVEIEGVLIAHTWGTESVLQIEGLEVGAPYVVVLVDNAGREYDSGTFLGSEVRIDCAMNAAVMRHEVTRLEIRDDDGAVVAESDLPEAQEA